MHKHLSHSHPKIAVNQYFRPEPLSSTNQEDVVLTL